MRHGVLGKDLGMVHYCHFKDYPHVTTLSAARKEVRRSGRRNEREGEKHYFLHVLLCICIS